MYKYFIIKDSPNLETISILRVSCEDSVVNGTYIFKTVLMSILESGMQVLNVKRYMVEQRQYVTKPGMQIQCTCRTTHGSPSKQTVNGISCIHNGLSMLTSVTNMVGR